MDPSEKQENHSQKEESTSENRSQQGNDGQRTPEHPQQDDIRNDQGDVAGKIFIGGLSWQTTEDTLRYYFSKYGELADVALMSDKKTGKPR